MSQQPSIEKLNDLWLRVIGIPLVTLIYTALLYYLDDSTVHGISALKTFSTGMVITLFIWEANRRILIHFRHKLPEIHQTKQRILYSVMGYTCFTLVFTTLVYCLFNAMLYWNRVIPLKQHYYNMINNLVFIVLIGGAYEMTYYFKKWKQTMAEGEQLKKEHLQSQLDVLKSHINPHFLFNSLNTLEALAEEKHEKTSDFVRQLANVYRFILQSNDKQLCSLKEELEFIRSYCFLLKTRFGNNIHFEISPGEHLHHLLLPPLTLQMLVENAMKHNIVSGTKPLYITIQEEDAHWLSVSNNLQKKSQAVLSDKTGLQNIQKRYTLLGKQTIRIKETSVSFKVMVPLLPVEPENLKK